MSQEWFIFHFLPPVQPGLRILQQPVEDGSVAPPPPPCSDESGVAASRHSKDNEMDHVTTSPLSTTMDKSILNDETHVEKTIADVDEPPVQGEDSASVKPVEPYVNDDVQLFGDDSQHSDSAQAVGSNTPMNQDDMVTVKTLEESNRYPVDKWTNRVICCFPFHCRFTIFRLMA